MVDSFAISFCPEQTDADSKISSKRNALSEVRNVGEASMRGIIDSFAEYPPPSHGYPSNREPVQCATVATQRPGLRPPGIRSPALAPENSRCTTSGVPLTTMGVLENSS